MEEKETNKVTPKQKIIFTVLLIVGIVLLVAGISLLVWGLITRVPSMNSHGWFDSQSSKMGKIFGGAVCIMFGVAAIIVGCSVRFSTKIEDSLFNDSDEVDEDGYSPDDLNKDGRVDASERILSILKNGKEEQSQKEKPAVYCQYCGTLIPDGLGKCPSCNAVRKDINKSKK